VDWIVAVELSAGTEVNGQQVLKALGYEHWVSVKPTGTKARRRGGQLPGTPIWDVMYSLGLEWGDMDLFHWTNESDFGDDQLFIVWTSTEPSYFLPELIAAGEVMTDDLSFSFSVPRCPAPVEVFDEMIKAAPYAQSGMGGTLAVVVDQDGALCKRRSEKANRGCGPPAH
jgi:FtsZ-interacting cell division protein ZipA